MKLVGTWYMILMQWESNQTILELALMSLKPFICPPPVLITFHLLTAGSAWLDISLIVNDKMQQVFLKYLPHPNLGQFVLDCFTEVPPSSSSVLAPLAFLRALSSSSTLQVVLES